MKRVNKPFDREYDIYHFICFYSIVLNKDCFCVDLNICPPHS